MNFDKRKQYNESSYGSKAVTLVKLPRGDAGGSSREYVHRITSVS